MGGVALAHAVHVLFGAHQPHSEDALARGHQLPVDAQAHRVPGPRAKVGDLFVDAVLERFGERVGGREDGEGHVDGHVRIGDVGMVVVVLGGGGPFGDPLAGSVLEYRHPLVPGQSDGLFPAGRQGQGQSHQGRPGADPDRPTLVRPGRGLIRYD